MTVYLINNIRYLHKKIPIVKLKKINWYITTIGTLKYVLHFNRRNAGQDIEEMRVQVNIPKILFKKYRRRVINTANNSNCISFTLKLQSVMNILQQHELHTNK